MRASIIQGTIVKLFWRNVNLRKICGIMFACLSLWVILPQVVQSAESKDAGTPVNEAGPDYSANRLVGTINGGKYSGAVFENATGEQKFYRSGETFSDGSRIISVHPTNIKVRTPEGSVVEYMVSRGTSGKPGTAQAGLPVAAPPVQYNPPPAVVEGDTTGTPKRKRGRPIHTDQDE